MSVLCLSLHDFAFWWQETCSRQESSGVAGEPGGAMEALEKKENAPPAKSKKKKKKNKRKEELKEEAEATESAEDGYVTTWMCANVHARIHVCTPAYTLSSDSIAHIF